MNIWAETPRKSELSTQKMGIEEVDNEACFDTDDPSSEGKKKGSITNAEKLLKIEPLDLKFTFEANKQISSSLFLSNLTENLVAFKVLSTNVTKFCAKPNYGIILPQTTCGISVTMQAQKEPPAEMKCKDKFKIQCVVLTRSEAQDIMQMFSKEGLHYIEEHKLPVVYVSRPLPLTPDYFDCAEKRELLKIGQKELSFPFEANKRISSSLQLSNMTENHVAFKVKTTHPKKFCVRPNRGIVLPQSTCGVVVTMMAQKALPEAQNKEKFMIQSALVSPATLEIDMDWELFKLLNDAGVVQEQKLRVVYTPATEEESFADAEGSKEHPPEMDAEENKDNAEEVRSFIQRNLRRFSSVFDKIVTSLTLTSKRRSWLFRTSSSGTGMHKRLLED